MKRPELLYDPAGWPYPDRPRLCGTQNLAPCHQPPVWRTTRHGRGYVQHGYYCDWHLPAEHRGDGPLSATESQDLATRRGSGSAAVTGVEP